MSFDVGLIASRLPDVFHALGVTVLVWIGGTICGLLLGAVVAVARRYGPAPLGWLLRLYVEIMRGTPFLIQLYLLYFGGPYIGLSLDPVPAGMLSLTVYSAAYFSEIVRTGFEAVPVGHIEAAECVGLSRMQVIRRIMVPEMTMLVLPPLINMVIVLLKETAVLSTITVPELTMVISAIGSESYAFVESLFLLALSYWGLVELCGLLGRLAERKLAHLKFSPS